MHFIQIRTNSKHKMLQIANITTEQNQAGRRRGRIRSTSSNPPKNKIQSTNMKRDRSASVERHIFKEIGNEKQDQKQKSRILSVMVPFLKKSVTPVSKFLAKRFNAKKINGICDICYDHAQMKHLGIFLCHTCKEFLDENAFKQDQIPTKCPNNGYCILQSFKLEMCPACRLKRFISLGLEPRLNHQQILITIQKPDHIPALSLLNQDGSCLSSDDWMLLSNLIHCFDIDRPKALAYQFIRENSSDSCPKICFKVPAYYNDLIESMYRVTHAFIYNNQDVYALPEFERQLVHRHGYNNIAMFCGPVVARHLHLLKNRAFVHSLDLSFGVTNRKCSEYIASKLDLDPYFIMFVMAIYVFSSSSCTSFCQRKLVACDDVNVSLALFRIQNVYTEVTWKYLIYRYAFEDAVKRFDNLIQCFIMAQNSLTVMENDRQHDAIRESLIAQTEIFLD